jgi:hypothetical protein
VRPHCLNLAASFILSLRGDEGDRTIASDLPPLAPPTQAAAAGHDLQSLTLSAPQVSTSAQEARHDDAYRRNAAHEHVPSGHGSTIYLPLYPFAWNDIPPLGLLSAGRVLLRQPPPHRHRVLLVGPWQRLPGGAAHHASCRWNLPGVAGRMGLEGANSRPRKHRTR